MDYEGYHLKIDLEQISIIVGGARRLSSAKGGGEVLAYSAHCPFPESSEKEKRVIMSVLSES
jgi:hypothetical protein